jgi:hypothetical protein
MLAVCVKPFQKRAIWLAELATLRRPRHPSETKQASDRQITTPALAARAAIIMKKLSMGAPEAAKPAGDEIADEAGTEPQTHHRRDNARAMLK